MGKKAKTIVIVIIFLFVLIYSSFEWFWIRQQSLLTRQIYNPQTDIVYRAINYITYKGENGKDALTLLKQKTAVVQDRSGLVTSIDGRKADNTKHEYWAFYVNGKLASVGPAQYVTKNNDTIEWKIEKY